jgi:hypothetical protein
MAVIPPPPQPSPIEGKGITKDLMNLKRTLNEEGTMQNSKLIRGKVR